MKIPHSKCGLKWRREPVGLDRFAARASTLKFNISPKYSQRTLEMVHAVLFVSRLRDEGHGSRAFRFATAQEAADAACRIVTRATRSRARLGKQQRPLMGRSR